MLVLQHIYGWFRENQIYECCVPLKIYLELHMDKISLTKLIEYIDELSHLPGNEWFHDKLKSKFSKTESTKLTSMIKK